MEDIIWQEGILGETDKAFPLARLGENKAAIIRLSEQAHKGCFIFSYSLERRIYDQAAVLDNLRKIAMSSRFSAIKILLHDPSDMVKKGHRVVELYRRLSSSIQMRKIHEDYQHLLEEYLIFDSVGIFSRKDYTRYNALVNFNSPLLIKQKLMLFMEIWEKSQEDPELRRLSI